MAVRGISRFRGQFVAHYIDRRKQYSSEVEMPSGWHLQDWHFSSGNLRCLLSRADEEFKVITFNGRVWSQPIQSTVTGDLGAISLFPYLRTSQAVFSGLKDHRIDLGGHRASQTSRLTVFDNKPGHYSGAVGASAENYALKMFDDTDQSGNFFVSRFIKGNSIRLPNSEYSEKIYVIGQQTVLYAKGQFVVFDHLGRNVSQHTGLLLSCPSR
ncbi:MAG: hypothetical protein JNK63_08075 [Chthonomonas sp.]|nr:hypothetical protein [Chthonomonas sp.]